VFHNNIEKGVLLEKCIFQLSGLGHMILCILYVVGHCRDCHPEFYEIDKECKIRLMSYWNGV